MAYNQVDDAAYGNTITALGRWSILDKKLPRVDSIRDIHIYDFDNTLFQTPLPNPKLWISPTIGKLGSPDIFINGGWWHDSRILAATGEGVEQEEKRAWDGWWNEKIVDLVRLSMRQNDALCVLLTGRSEQGFSQLIKRIVNSKGLEFDMIGLKPAVGPNSERFQSTMDFKQIFLRSILSTYTEAKEMRIYEDRPRHVEGFRNFLDDINRQRVHDGQGSIVAEVVPVAELSATLDPINEVAEVQHLIDDHNSLVKSRAGDKQVARMAIKRVVFFTSYMVQPTDTKRLIALLKSIIPEVEDLKYLANTILITSKPCPQQILDKIGGLNSKMKWEVADIGSYQTNLWAVRVRPVPANAAYHTDNPSPSVVLALRRGARPPDVNKIRYWQAVPSEKTFTFETTVGEKVMLRIDREDHGGDQTDDRQEKVFSNRGSKRKYPGDEDRRPRHHGGDYGNGNRDHHTSAHQGRGGGENRDHHTSAHQGRGGGENRGRGGYRGGGAPRGNRGRGGFRGSGRGNKGAHGYRSLDDVDARDNPQGGFSSSAVSYDDRPPSLQQGGPPFPYSLLPPPPPLPPQYGQPYSQPGQQQWPTPGGGVARPQGGNGPDLQKFY
ncbi:hypothetical protein F4804DRAFT_334593 [Jackrogersella minutella]|nr:hypothetical protein F4804DRAFT_334593 [Jackrogersella minutella]